MTPHDFDPDQIPQDADFDEDEGPEEGGPCLVTLSFATMDEATRISRLLVTAELAACIQLIPGATSIYRWEGAVTESSEVLAAVKTTQELLPELLARIDEEHSYDTPEFLIYEIVGGSPSYMDWFFSSVRSPIEPED